MCGKFYIPEGEGMVCPECSANGGPQVEVKNIHIENSYTTWSTTMMSGKMIVECWQKYREVRVDRVLNRSYRGMYIEWYLHNIGYWLTLPFIKNNKIKTKKDLSIYSQYFLVFPIVAIVTPIPPSW